MNNEDNTAGREFRITRILPAPIEKVWKVWTDPELIKDWWGPEGHTTIIKTMEAVEGGEWLFTIQGPDGQTYPNRAVFTEIVPLKRIIFEHFNPGFIATITFAPTGNETSMVWTMLFETSEKRDTLVKVFKADVGLEQNGDKLVAYLRNNKAL